MARYLRFFILCLFLFLSTSPLLSAPQETLPTWHWSYDYIEQLQRRGYCLDLDGMNKPYTRGEVARSLAKALVDMAPDFVEQGSPEYMQGIMGRLAGEFAFEIELVKKITGVKDMLHLRTNFRADMVEQDQGESDYRGVYRAGIGARFSKNVYAYSGYNFDQYAYNDDMYKGYKWRGLAAYAEQAYVTGVWDKFKVRFGRDYLKWGPGESGTLVMSDVSRPLDHLSVSAGFGPFRYQFFAAALDDYPRVKVDDTVFRTRRYLSGHRIGIHLWGGRLQAAVSEIMQYGGVNETFDPVYLNPVIFYHGSHKNDSGKAGNVLPTLDVLVYPTRTWQVYTSLLIDDIQIESAEVDDMEPNEIGWIIGTKWADPFDVYGMTLLAEYALVTNRTYNTPMPLETFVHRNKPLGHPLGNDFDHWQFGCQYILKNNVWLQLNYLRTRQGEGSIYTPFDTPWRAFTVEEGYDEPFPTGVVETTNCIGMDVTWYPRNRVRVLGDVDYVDVENEFNIEGESAGYWEWRVRVEFDWTLGLWK